MYAYIYIYICTETLGANGHTYTHKHPGGQTGPGQWTNLQMLRRRQVSRYEQSPSSTSVWAKMRRRKWIDAGGDDGPEVRGKFEGLEPNKNMIE